jgi:hypothetical protein
MSARDDTPTVPMGPSEGFLDPDALLERLVDLHEASLSWHRCARLELYHRSSVTLRVTLRGDEKETFTRVGSDEGLAVRVERPGERGTFFAASAGGDAAKLRWALDHALRGRPERPGEGRGEGWPSDRASSLVDHDPEARLPSPAELGGWLTRALEALHATARRRGAPLEVERAWVEAALTVESWAAEMGMRCSRRRLRAWAMAHVREKAGAERVLPVASRSWAELPDAGWRRLAEQLGVPRRRRRPPERGRTDLVFTPATSATLVAALARAIHLGPQETGSSVGPGWSVSDEPHHPEALFGGLFDDAGFYTAATRLAQDGEITGNLNGEGHFRRSSFRDRPESWPSWLVVEARPRPVPGRGLIVSDLRIHPLRPQRWTLEVTGYPLPEGLDADTRIEGYIQVAPRELLWHCAACLGPTHASALGVSTGSLLFEDIEVG